MKDRVDIKFTVEYKITKDNIKIINSYRIKEKWLMENILLNISSRDTYKRDRIINDYIKEWRTHNILYKLPFKHLKEHCKDCDLSNNESKFRLFIYNILGRF